MIQLTMNNRYRLYPDFRCDSKDQQREVNRIYRFFISGVGLDRLDRNDLHTVRFYVTNKTHDVV